MVEQVWKRWTEYFKPLLNGNDVGEANINVVDGFRMPVLGDEIEDACVGNIDRGSMGGSK